MSAPAGWYADPSQPGMLRWWDGAQWTARSAAALPSGTDWRRWMTSSPAAKRIGVLLAVLALLAAAVCVIVIVVNVARQRAVANVAVLLIAGVPLLAAGQLWTIGLMQARRPPAIGPRKRGLFNRQSSRPTNPRTFFFGPLAARLAWSLFALTLLGWLAALTAIPFITGGNRADAGDGCVYRLESHGSYSCVSRSTYEQAGAGGQQFAAGILLAFYSLHAGAALGGLAQRRASAVDQPS